MPFIEDSGEQRRRMSAIFQDIADRILSGDILVQKCEVRPEIIDVGVAPYGTRCYIDSRRRTLLVVFDERKGDILATPPPKQADTARIREEG